MKLLLVSDQNTILNQFEKLDDYYRFGNIQIHFLLCENEAQLENVFKRLENERYHLVLTITRASFQGKFIENENLVNSVNNYLAKTLQKNQKNFESGVIQIPNNNVVNKTTSYFNVFLEIVKAVSMTSLHHENYFNLTRLDVFSELNYYLAYALQKSRCNYYILNYSLSFPKIELIDILRKID